MNLATMIPLMVKGWQDNKASAQYKKDLFNIHEGDLFGFIDTKLKETLGPESSSYKYAKSRIAPINLLQKVITKSSQIYNDGPTRNIVDSENEADQELLEWYIRKFDMNSKMDVVNENYNMTKIGLVMPVVDEGNPELRVYPSHHFMVFSFTNNNPQKVQVLMTYQGCVDVYDKHGENRESVDLFYAYSDDQFIAFTSDGNIHTQTMLELDNPLGENIYGRIPAMYVNKSRTLLMPLDDTDLKEMVIIIPLLMSDLNLASMFTAFSIIYGIDIDDEGLKYTPSAFWNIKSDPTSDKKPEIGTIKPEADIEETLKLIASQLSMWLNSRGLRPGTVGDMSTDGYVSGISKIVDEADATESRKKQGGIFARAEENDFWDLMINHIHPTWVKNGMLESNQLFTPNARVRVKFPEPDLLRPRSQQVLDAKEERDAGFVSVRRAIKNLNPEMDDNEVDELIAEINAESSIEVPNGGEMAQG